MKFELNDLPYAYDALDPFLKRETLEIHHTKHHAGYVKKLDDALEDDEMREASLETILLSSSGNEFNLAAQVWNHDFYWKSLTPSRSELSDDEDLLDCINRDFGDLTKFKAQFKETAANEFGSGWAWLAYHPERERLEIFSTTDALNPLTSGRIPLLTLDVWEHAYYLDYQNERGRYIDAFLEDHINWAFAENNLATYLKENREKKAS